MFLFAAILLYQAGGLGITAGAHRLWAHRAYKAKWPLRLILMLFNTLAFQVNNRYLENKLEVLHNLKFSPTVRVSISWRYASVSIISAEDGEIMFLQNIGIYKPVSMGSAQKHIAIFTTENVKCHMFLINFLLCWFKNS